MKRWLVLPLLLAAVQSFAAPVPIFDGKTLDGWDYDPAIWRVEDGMITGGSTTEKIKANYFICTKRNYANFDLRLKIKCSGDPKTGLINSGIQIRSLRVPGGAHMIGYQVDCGAGWFGKIYDEFRRNKVIATPVDQAALDKVVDVFGWNEYRIRAEGPRIQAWINDVLAIDYTEIDPNIALDGQIGPQVHSGGVALVQVKDVTIEELPPTPNAPTWEHVVPPLGGKQRLPEPERPLPPKRGTTSGKRDISYNAVATTAKTPEEERAAFTLPDGFEAELVAAESEGIGKFVPIAFDQHGALWTTTALEYPVDGNENPAAADALYASKAKDKVLVFDRDPKSPTGYSPKARIFAEGLALPLGVLPYKNGCYVQHGHDIAFLEDTDGDGKSDKRTVSLTGFGVQDSHLFPHQFMRAPGGWIWMAQGAFNYSKVRRPEEPAEKAVQFDQTRMAKFRPDGSGFDITSNGPCNIWGLVLNGEGEAFIQEANDFGYPVMPFHEYANYPGCSDRQWKSYAPEFPGTAPDFKMGGTGLSGLAIPDAAFARAFDEAVEKQTLSSRTERSGVENRSAAEMAAGEGGRKPLASAGSGGAERKPDATASSAPPPPADARGPSTPLRSAQDDKGGGSAAQTMLVANPITNRIQAIKMHRDGPYWKLDKPVDFLVSEDPWFRPVAITVGPDGCLYIVDWYNKIISHNEVPRNHPDRDKTRGRIWRVKVKATKPFDVPDFTKLSGDELIAKLGSESLAQSHLAWQALADRKDVGAVEELRAIATDTNVPAARRIAALWTLEEAAPSELPGLPPLLADPSRNIRREVVRAIGGASAVKFTKPRNQSIPFWLPGVLLVQLGRDADSEVRAAAIGVARQYLDNAVESGAASDAIESSALCLTNFAREPLAAPVAPSTRNGKPIKVREAYDREFERYLVRMFLERQPDAVAKFLDSDAAKPLPVEARLLASLALEPKASAARVAKLLPQLQRGPGQEEVLRLAQFPEEPGVGDALRAILASATTRGAAVESLIAVKTRLDGTKLAPFLTDAANALLTSQDAGSVELATRLASGFQLGGMEAALVSAVKAGTSENHDWVKGDPSHRTSLELTPSARQALRALREMRSDQVELFEHLVRLSSSSDLRDEALVALADSKAADAPKRVLALYPNLAPAQRRAALERLSATKPGAGAIVAALDAKTIPTADLDGPTLDRLQAVLGTNDPSLTKLIDSLGNLFRPVLTLDGSDDAWIETDLTFDGPLTVENWVRLAPGITNADGLLGTPGKLDINFFGGNLRVHVGGALHDVIVAKKPIMPELWTHVAAVRDAEGRWSLYADGELDPAQAKAPAPGPLEKVRIGWTGAKGGTAGAFAEYRLWTRARTAAEIRRDFDRSLEAENAPGLVFRGSGATWGGKPQKGAKIAKTSDLPPILTAEEAATLDAKYAKNRALAAQPGEAARGKITAALCQACHLMGPTGGNIGPNLSGVGAMGTEAILRNILQPNAAMENGYRIYRLELKSGDLVDALFVSEDKDAVVIRMPGVEDRRIAKTDIRSAKYLRRSLMPEGLLDAMAPQQVSDLFAYLLSLK